MIWGTGGVVLFLASAIARLIPIALEALRMDLEPLHIAVLALSVLALGYYEGYRAFQKGFSPRTVARALAVAQHPRPIHVLLAPILCMQLFHATKKRVLVSWGVLLGVTGLVLIVRMLDQPWRGIIDAGVVVGLSWGTISILVFAIRALMGRPMPVPPDLPEGSV
jgi:hypothetical protein